MRRLSLVALLLMCVLLTASVTADSGEDIHYIGTEVEITLKEDLNRLKKVRSYRGVRHENNLPVRGQRTRSNGRTGMTVGVQRKSS